MYDSDFQNYLSEETGIDLITIDDLFEKEVDAFDVAFELIENYGIDAKKLGKIWGDYLGFAYVDPNASIVHKEYIQRLGLGYIRKYNVLPLYKFGKAVTVATSDPNNPFIQDKLEKKLDELVSFVFCFPFDIEIYIQFKDCYKL